MFSMKLLIADDNARMRQMLRSLCARPDDTVIECGDGAAAVAAFAAHRPDWVVMDLRMPGMNGLEATHAILARDGRARVIVISEFSGAEYAEQARRAGAVEFVNKEDLFRLPLILRPLSPGASPSSPTLRL